MVGRAKRSNVVLLCVISLIVVPALVHKVEGSDGPHLAGRVGFGAREVREQDEIRDALGANQKGPIGEALGDLEGTHLERNEEARGFQDLQSLVVSVLSTLPPSVKTPVDAVDTLVVADKLMAISSSILKKERINVETKKEEFKKNTSWFLRLFKSEDKLPPKLAAPMLIFFKGLHALARLHDVKFKQKDYDDVAGELDIQAFSRSIGSLHDSMEEFLMNIPEEYSGGSVVYNVRHRINDVFKELDIMSSKLAAAKKRLTLASAEERDPCLKDSDGESEADEVEDIVSQGMESEKDIDIWNAHLVVGDIEDDMAASTEKAREMVRKNRASGAEEARRFAGYVAVTGLAGAAHFTKDMYSLAWPYQRDFKAVPGPQFGRMYGAGQGLSESPGRAMDLKDRSVELLEDSQGLTDRADGLIQDANDLGTEIDADVQTLSDLGDEQMKLAQEQKAIYDEMQVLQEDMKNRAPYPPTNDQVNRMNDLQAQSRDKTREMQQNQAEMEQTAKDIQDKRAEVEQMRGEAEELYEEGMVSYEKAKGIRDDALDLIKDAEGHIQDFIEAAKTTFVETPLAIAENAVTVVVSFLPDLIVTGLEMAIGILTGPFFVLTAAHLLYRIIKFALRPPQFRHSDICSPKMQKQCCYDELMSWNNIIKGDRPVPKFDISWVYSHEPQGDCAQTQAWLRANYELLNEDLMSPLGLGKKRTHRSFDKDVVRNVCAKVQKKMVCNYKECQMCKQLAAIGTNDFSKEDFCESFKTHGSGFAFSTVAKASASALQTGDVGERIRSNPLRRKKFDDYYNYHLCTAMRNHFNKYHSSKRLRKGEIFPAPLCAESGFCLNSEFWVTERRPECALCRKMALFKGIGGTMKSVCKKVSTNFVEVSKNCDEVYKKLKEEPAQHSESVHIKHYFSKDDEFGPNTCPTGTYLTKSPGYGNQACKEYCDAQKDLLPLILPGDGSVHEKYALADHSTDLWGLDETSSTSFFGKVSRWGRKIFSRHTVDDRFSIALEYLEGEQVRWSNKKSKWDSEMEELNTSRILNYKIPVGGVTGFASSLVSEICAANAEEIEAAKKSLLKFDTFLLDRDAHMTMEDYNKELLGVHSFFVEFRLLIHGIKARYLKYEEERLPKIVLPEQRTLSGVAGTAVEEQVRSWQTTLKCETRVVAMYRKLAKRTDELIQKAKEEVSKFDNAVENFVDTKISVDDLLKLMKKAQKAFQESRESILKVAKKKKVVDLIDGVDPYSKCYIRALKAVKHVERLEDWKIAKADLKRIKEGIGKKGSNQFLQILLKNVAGLLERTVSQMNLFENQSNLRIYELRDLTAFAMEQFRIGFRSTTKFETARGKLERQVTKSIETWTQLDGHLVKLHNAVIEAVKPQMGVYEDLGSIDPEDTLEEIKEENAKRKEEEGRWAWKRKELPP